MRIFHKTKRPVLTNKPDANYIYIELESYSNVKSDQ
jgi:hypothetical protein